MVGFRNDKTLMREKVVSEREFPVKTVFYDDRNTYAVLDLSDKKQFDNYIKALSYYIVNKYEGKILKRIILKNYPDVSPFSVNEIIKLKDEIDDGDRVKVVEEILRGYFSENDSGNVEGLINFRLFEYKKVLKTLAEDLVDIFYLNREYEEFIELLRYFISVQTARPDLIYIDVKKEGMYSILNAKEEDITKRCLAEFLRPEEIQGVGYDDLLISVLITLAPEKIIVKNKENIKNRQLFETIEKVFGELEYK